MDRGICCHGLTILCDHTGLHTNGQQKVDNVCLESLKYMTTFKLSILKAWWGHHFPINPLTATTLLLLEPSCISAVAIWCSLGKADTVYHSSVVASEPRTRPEPHSNRPHQGDGSRDCHYAQLARIITSHHSPSICTAGDSLKPHRLFWLWQPLMWLQQKPGRKLKVRPLSWPSPY